MNTVGGVPVPLSDAQVVTDVASGCGTALATYQATQNAAIDGQANSVLGAKGGWNSLIVPVDFSLAAWNTKDADHVVLNVSGLVEIEVLPVIDVAITSGGNPGDTFALQVGRTMGLGTVTVIAATARGTLWPAVNTILYNTTGSSAAAPYPSILHYITQLQVIYRIGINAFAGGTVTFNCRWRAIAPGATVIAGLGGVNA